MQELIVDLPAPKPLRLGETALFLDLDGTLAPIAARPQDVRPDPRRTTLLARLAERMDGRLAVVSGRTLADVDRILEGRVTAVAAVHGLVLRDPHGAMHTTPPHHDLAKALEGFRKFARRHDGLLVEEKGSSVALHFRQAPTCAETARACARTLAADTGLILQDGDMVAELRTPGPSKGDSVRAFMCQSPFTGARPVFVGDDVTDEDGFAAAQDLGGIGVGVGRRSPTLARRRLTDVDAALAWLEAAA
jgi:trehalose 6-phosphate phosphatase